jgi:diaminopimelate decarboxylase
MSDNIRTALYDAVYDCRLVSRSTERDGSGEAVLSRVVGKHCESGDIVVRDCWLPPTWPPAT